MVSIGTEFEYKVSVSKNEAAEPTKLIALAFIAAAVPDIVSIAEILYVNENERVVFAQSKNLNLTCH